MDVKQLGQVFTPPDIVRRMLSLRKNRGAVLEPSAGNGAFLRHLESGAVGLEIDPTHAAASGAIRMDFFDYPAENKFDTIIGNPPYVRHRDIPEATRKKLKSPLLDGRANLFLFFIEKCAHHLRDGGELIFITPRDFLKLTAASRLNRMLHDSGTITDCIETGDARIFADASPNCAIWRFVKGDFSRRTADGRKFSLMNGQIAFVQSDYTAPLADIFAVKVGAVSGMDAVFANPRHGNRDFVCSQTAATGNTRRMIYNIRPDCLLPHKQQLMARKIRPFNESNWWQWGRAHFESKLPRLYVNAKTRARAPFFTHPSPDYDGSVLALFPRRASADLSRLCAMLNEVDWKELGFVCDGRFLFGQRSLQTCLLPSVFPRESGMPLMRV